MNVAHLHGHLGADPEVRHTSSGDQITSLRLATSSKSKGTEYTEWHRVVCFGKTAEVTAKYLKKGSGLIVEGRIQTNKWKDNDGNDRYTTEIVANRVHFVGGRGERSEAREKPQAQETQEDLSDDIPF